MYVAHFSALLQSTSDKTVIIIRVPARHKMIGDRIVLVNDTFQKPILFILAIGYIG
jgi:hypothetical protein